MKRKMGFTTARRLTGGSGVLKLLAGKNVKGQFLFILLLLLPVVLSAQAGSTGGKEIKNSVAAVKAANPGDYILSPTGKKYVLTKEEIAAMNGEFDYSDLSKVKTAKTLEDGTEIKIISIAHSVYVYPDGGVIHAIKTVRSFTMYMRDEIDARESGKYQLGTYIASDKSRCDSMIEPEPEFDVFRARVQFQGLEKKDDQVTQITVTAYNYTGEIYEGTNFQMRFYDDRGWRWGNVEDGGYRPVGEPHTIEFDRE